MAISELAMKINQKDLHQLRLISLIYTDFCINLSQFSLILEYLSKFVVYLIEFDVDLVKFPLI